MDHIRAQQRQSRPQQTFDLYWIAHNESTAGRKISVNDISSESFKKIEDAKAKIKEIKNVNNNEGLLDGIYRTFINSDDKRSEKCSILLASLGHKIEDYGRYEICQFLFRHMQK